MTCARECIQRCKNDGNEVITGAGLSDVDDSNYSVATNDPGVGWSLVVQVNAAPYGLKRFSLRKWKAVVFECSEKEKVSVSWFWLFFFFFLFGCVDSLLF